MDEASLRIYRIFDSNPLIWGYHYFPHHFRINSPPFHLKIIKEGMICKYLAVQAPRGSAKSTMLGFLKLAHSISFRRKRFIIIVQNTYSKAAQSLETIKEEIKNNKKFVNDFGIRVTKDREGDSIFNVGGHRVRVLCKGAEQIGSIRGEKFGAYRPDLVLGDDMEDDELVRNPERRSQFEKDFNDVLKYVGDTDTQFIILGTILHDDALMAKLVSSDNYPMYRKLFYKARWDVKGVRKSLWKEKWSVEDLDKMEAEDPSGFAKEMQGDPSSGSLETISRNDFRYWRMEDNHALLYDEFGKVLSKWSLKDCKAAIGIDLGWAEEVTNDFSAVVPGLCTPANDILVDDYVNKRGMRPNELENLIFDMSARYEAITGKRVQVGFEKAVLEKVLKWFLGEAQKRRNQWLWTKDIAWGTSDKIERILSRVGNRYSQHSIYHKRGMGVLENQMIRLRSVAHDDIADAVAMLPVMLFYAPTVLKKKTEEDNFNWWAKQTSSYRENHRTSYRFGAKEAHPFPFKTHVAPELLK